ncbi:hypothetical protein MFIFM68171_09869 [Madurella fahalii]|uniref:F-box domain-containing protein n=1 Tax=Madurella fahalii TaxID=1157608 RepID=A0ABQ0GPL8_9PEZI
MPPGQHSGGFEKLPPEVLELIFGPFRPTGPVTAPKIYRGLPSIQVGTKHAESRAAFASFCRVSKYFHYVATDYLYRTVHITDGMELLCFCRTLMEYPDRCTTIREFSWVGRFQMGLRTPGSSDTPDARLLQSFWAPIASRMRHDPFIADVTRSVGLTGPDGLIHTWKVLGTVLAILPNVQSLHFLHASSSASDTHQALNVVPRQRDPEEDAFWAWMLGAKLETSSDSAPCRRFLQSLERLVLEAQPYDNYHCPATDELLFALFACPRSLRRVELNGTTLSDKLPPTVSAAAERVRELVLYRDFHSADELSRLVESFPNLISLEAECRDPFVFRRPAPVNPFLALLSLADTLETLNLTSGLNSWSSVRVWNALPLLQFLDRMICLKHLTTESIWLFGNQCFGQWPPKDVIALPPSLVSFRLVDYWGVGGKAVRNPATRYYPDFRTWTPIGFYYHHFSSLQEERVARLPNFSEFTFVTSWLHLTRASLVTDGPSNEQLLEDAAEYEEEWRSLFAGAGVRFSVISSEESRQLFPRLA